MVALAALALALLVGPGTAVAQFDSDLFNSTDGFRFDLTDGALTWFKHIGGGGPGQQPFTGAGGSVPIFLDNGALIVEGQGLVTNDGDAGGTVGINRRFFAGNALVGAGFWYDVNQSPSGGNVFQQSAFSLETFLDDWTFRSNGYLPVGPRVNNVVNSAGSGTATNIAFQGNNLVANGVQTLRLDEAGMRGIEIEIARNVGTWTGEVFVGYYNFRGKIGGSTDGIKGGARGYLTPRLAGNVTISDDPLFGTNVYGGFTWFLGGTSGSAPRTIEEKLTIPVERNQQVVINNVASGVNTSGPLILTSGGNPINITHVDANAGGASLGTFDNPFLNLPPAQNSNIVYVHADGTYLNQSYGLNPNQRFLGEGGGNNHIINTDQLGPIILPPGNGGANRPVIQGVDGQFALNSNANTEIANVVIDNTGPGFRSGIFGQPGNVNVNRTLIAGGFTGIDILGGTGQFTFSDVTVTDQTLSGLRITGGNANIAVSSGSSISQGTGAAAVRVDGGHHGSLSFDGSIDGMSGDGLQFDDADGQYDFRGQVQLNGGDAGIDILGGSAGTFTFTNTDITDPTSDGLNINGGSSTVIFDGLSSINKNNAGSAVRVQGGHDGTLTFNPDTGITVTGPGAGDGLQFDDADGQYDFRGQVQLNGGDAGIDILGGSAGTFTFSNTEITDPTGEGLNINGGGSTVIFDGLSSINKNNAGSTVRVQGGHDGTLTFNPDTGITVTGPGAGDGLQFDDADGEYDFRGQVQLNGGDAGIDILGGSAGTFTFTNTDITDPTGEGLNINGGGSTVIFDGLSSINKNNAGSTVRVQGGHDGTLTFNPDTGITVTGPGAGDGLQFDDADGQYDFRGHVQLNGGDAGIDILGGSAGTFTFANTTIADPTGPAFRVQNFGAGGVVNYDGSISSTGGADLIDIDTTAAGSQINFNNAGANTIFGNGAGGILIFDADGNVAVTTPTTIVDPVNGFAQTGISIFGGGTGTIGFTDTNVQLPSSGNAGVEINGHLGTVTFSNLEITTNGPGIVGLSVFQTSNVNVTGTNSINTTGGDGIIVDDVGTINMMFDTVTVTGSVAGFGGGSGITLTDVGGGSFDVTGTSIIDGAQGPAGIGIDIDDSAGTFTFADVDINDTTLDGIAVGSLFGNPGTVNINGGTISNTGANGVTANNAGGFNLNNTTFNNTGGFTADVTGSTVSGAGNIAVPFSAAGAGNTGTILFNAGADSTP